ncbi:MAG TPA: glutamine--tRNA ligase/YqeY domain fusion protein [Casimicrobiaceae bacterium]|nr:glutamine--tRNA ligase/YqeY domain fusion protein [Casimicrobiaceae bacterium]
MTAAVRQTAEAVGSNFLRQIIAEDLRAHKYGGRVVTRFPPEPNGYLHIGHAKSICLNFGLAAENGGVCHLRFDDTNPVKEDVEYEESIKEAVRWLDYDWGAHLYHASDYFERLYEFARHFIKAGLAYVDSSTPEEMRALRGTLTEPGRPSIYRDRSVEENLDLFRRMKEGEFPDGAHVLRLKIDLASPNINLRDPAIYRIRHTAHHRTGNKWCVYPLYDYTHCISDALERITHSLCTLEFQDHRPLYDWVIEQLAQAGLLQRPLPHQYEFARLNLTYTVMSKRKLIELVEGKHVDGWDDPRLPTLAGLRRRGYTPEAIRVFAERIGVSKAHQWIDIGVLEDCLREDLNARAERRIAVLDPIKLVIDNYPEAREEECFAPNHPQKPELGRRSLPFARELWIEREDYEETPPKGYFRLSPGAEVRLRYGYIVKCLGAERDPQGNVVTVHCTYDPDTRSGTPGAETRKVKGNIHWLAVGGARAAEVRLYDRLFVVPQPGRAAQPSETGTSGSGTGRSDGMGDTIFDDDVPFDEATERNYLDDLNPEARKTAKAYVEPALASAPREARYQFERHGYFIADANDHDPSRPVFNRAVTLRDSWGRETSAKRP